MAAVRTPAKKSPTTVKPRTASKLSTKKPAVPKQATASTHPPRATTTKTEAVIAKVRAICMALPEVTEVIAWAEPTWRVGGKMFAMFDNHHHGSPHLSVWLKAAPGAQEALIEADPTRFWRPPYLGHKGWIAVIVDDKPPWDMFSSLVDEAYQLIAPKRLRR